MFQWMIYFYHNINIYYLYRWTHNIDFVLNRFRFNELFICLFYLIYVHICGKNLLIHFFL